MAKRYSAVCRRRPAAITAEFVGQEYRLRPLSSAQWGHNLVRSRTRARSNSVKAQTR
jgi:hypothetical protein